MNEKKFKITEFPSGNTVRTSPQKKEELTTTAIGSVPQMDKT